MSFYKLRLLFDNHVNVTGDTRSEGQSYPTYNDLSAEMKTFYDMTLIDEASAQLVHDQFGQKRPIPAGSGKTIEFRKFTALPKATDALTEGVTPDGKRLDVTAVTATVNQYGDYITQSVPLRKQHSSSSSEVIKPNLCIPVSNFMCTG